MSDRQEPFREHNPTAPAGDASGMPDQPAPDGINAQSVGAWLVEHVPGAMPPFRYELITGGRSNLTFCVTDSGGRRCVLRRPPLGTLLATAHDVVREYRIAAALADTPVPVAPAIAVCADASVNGAPFAVTGFVDGVVLDGPAKAAAIAPDARRALAFHLIDVLAELHAVDLDAVGLAELSRQDSYIERQVRRWAKQWAGSRTWELPIIDEVESRLRERLPVQHGAAIVHGDYRFGNCIVDLAKARGRRRARLGAVHARRSNGGPGTSGHLLARCRAAVAGRQRSDVRRRLPVVSRPPPALRDAHRP